MQDKKIFDTIDGQKNARPKLAYFPWDFVGQVKNIYPEYDFVPFHRALLQKEKIKILVGFKGKNSFLARLFGFQFWTLHEGLYRLSGHKPCSFILERFGNYTDARHASEWEEWMLSIPALLSTFERVDRDLLDVFSEGNLPLLEKELSHDGSRDLPSDINKNGKASEGSGGENDDDATDTQKQESPAHEFSSFMRNVLRRLPSAFPALAPHDREEAKELVDSLLAYRLSSDRYAPDASPYQLSTPSGRKRVLIIDEEHMGKGDLRKVLATERSFVDMLESAKKEHSGAAFFLLEPKSVRSNKKKGYLRKLAEANGVKVLSNDVSSISILEQAEVVYTVSSYLGVDAIFLGKKVNCFGMPFYAGWGLTKDKIQIDRRNVKRSREEFFAALCLFFTRYRHPITGASCSFQEILRFIILQRPLPIELDRYIACIHFDGNLKSFCQRFFSHSRLSFTSQEKGIIAAKANKGMIFTAKEPDDAMRKACGSVPLVFVSMGVLDRLLGKEKLISLSLEGGAYPTLERILQKVKPSEQDLLRARLFRQYLREISAFRTHYNFNHVPKEKNIILLIGNVLLAPDKLDALKKKGAASVSSEGEFGNLDAKGLPVHSFSSPLSDDAALIERVRELRKDAHIIYCPQVEGMNVPEAILKLVDDIKPYAKPSDFIPLSVLGISANTCGAAPEDEETIDSTGDVPADSSADSSASGMSIGGKSDTYSDISPAFIIDEDVECLPNFNGADFTKWSRKHIASKRFLEKAHSMTKVNGQFCLLYFPIHEVSGHAVEVHTYDSYLGLDALSVSMDVFTYGLPFYAGWGLTHDVAKFPMRTRPMTTESLFAGAFILQPRYFDYVNDIFCEPGNAPYLLTRDSEKEMQ